MKFVSLFLIKLSTKHTIVEGHLPSLLTHISGKYECCLIKYLYIYIFLYILKRIKTVCKYEVRIEAIHMDRK